MKSTSVPVLNSLVFIRDPTNVDRLEIDGIGRVWSSDSAVAVGCVPDCDGDTTITIGWEDEVSPDAALVFDGVLPTPSGTIVVETVPAVTVLETNGVPERTRVRIWTDGSQATERVTIGLG